MLKHLPVVMQFEFRRLLGVRQHDHPSAVAAPGDPGCWRFGIFTKAVPRHRTPRRRLTQTASLPHLPGLRQHDYSEAPCGYPHFETVSANLVPVFSPVLE
jgi:hypothetical protein